MTPFEQRIFELVRAELRPEFIPPEYRNLISSEYCGHCHHATVAMYNLLGGKETGYKIGKAIDELQIKHYWLLSPNGEIIDPTAEQYTDLNRPLPYANSIKRGISYRKTKYAKEIIASVQQKLSQD